MKMRCGNCWTIRFRASKCAGRLKPRGVDARRAAFWSRRWLLGVAIPAVAAVIVIVIMNRANAPRLIAPPAQVASDQVALSHRASTQEAAPLEAKQVAKKQAIAKAKTLDQVARAIPPLAPQLPIPAHGSTRVPTRRQRQG